jgi:hypothetical protein
MALGSAQKEATIYIFACPASQDVTKENDENGMICATRLAIKCQYCHENSQYSAGSMGIFVGFCRWLQRQKSRNHLATMSGSFADRSNGDKIED